MTRIRSIRTMTAVFALVALAGATVPAYAQRTSEARIKELIRQAAEQVAGGQAVTPTPNAQPPGPTRPVVQLTLDDAVKLALDHNLDIAVQRLNPAINDISVASLRAIYSPSLTSTLATQSLTTASATSVAGASVGGVAIPTGLTTYNGGIAQAVPWGGGSFVATLNNNKSTTEAQNALFNPAYNVLWTGQYTQPLMRGFKTDSNRQIIEVTKITRDISDVQLRAIITNTLSNVRNAYWDYVFAVQSVEVAQQGVDLAQQLVNDNQTRVQVGTMAPIDVVTAQAAAALQRQTLVAAQAAVKTAELALKRILVAGTQDPLWNSNVDPTDRPEFQVPEPIDIDAAVRRALSERTDLSIAQMNLKQNDTTLKFLSDQLLPQADLVALYGLTGLGGTQLIKSGTSVNAPVASTIPGGFGDALSTVFHTNYPRWIVTMNLSYPLGLSSAKATVARARVQMSQDQAQLKQLELQVATDVTNAAVTAQSNVERVQAAQAARVLSQQQLDAERSKFEVGLSTNYFVVQAESQLATAQNNELQAILAYRKSLVELDRLQQTTLQSLNVTLVSNATR